MLFGLGFVLPGALAVGAESIQGDDCNYEMGLGYSDVTFADRLQTTGPVWWERDTTGKVHFEIYTPVVASAGSYYYYSGIVNCAVKTVKDIVDCLLGGGADVSRLAACLG